MTEESTMDTSKGNSKDHQIIFEEQAESKQDKSFKED